MKTITAVPEFLTQAQYVSLFAALGFEPKQLRSLEYRTDGVYAEVYELTERGYPRIDVDRNEAIVNKVFIPVRDPEPATNG